MWLITLITLTGLSGCATVPQRNDWTTYTGPGAEYFQKEEYKLPYVPDPLEPVNRIAWAANEFILFDILEPVSAAWRFIVPQEVRTHLAGAAENITYPVRLVNHLLQGNGKAAATETRRFLINSTVGVLGLFDQAEDWGIEPEPTDLGLTFVSWGWNDSPYLVLPGVGPSTVRDALGRAGDLFLDPTSYDFIPTGLASRFIQGSESITSLKRLVRSSYDAYGPTRLGWTVSRWPGRSKALEGPNVGSAIETLKATLLTYRDPWFPAHGRTYRVKIKATGKKLPYDVWLQKKPAPMIFLMPGLGAHRQASQIVALAEMLYRHGYSAAVFSSALSFEFMETASTVWVPGYAPVDAHDIHVALDAVARDLDKRFPGRVTSRVFMGVSLGAFHGLYIASESERGDHTLIDFDRYLLLDPPVSLMHATEQLDAFYNTPLSYPRQEREAHVRIILKKAVGAIVNEQVVQEGIPFTENEARFLIGLSFRLFLHDIIWSSQRRHNMGVLKTRLDPMRRAASSDEILDFSFMEYFYAFILPYYLDQHAISSSQQMFQKMDARCLTGSLPTDGRIRVFVNADDFVSSDQDRQWLVQVLGKSNVTIRPQGGHMGQIYKPAVQEEIMDALNDLLQRR